MEPSLEGGKIEQASAPVADKGGRDGGVIRRVIEAAKNRLTGNQKKVKALSAVLGEEAVAGALENDKKSIASLEAVAEEQNPQARKGVFPEQENIGTSGPQEDEPKDSLSQELVADLEKALSNRRFDKDEHAKFTEYMEEELGDPDLKKALLDNLSTFGPEFSPARRFSLLADMMVFDSPEARKIAFEAIKGLLSSGISLESTIGAKEGFRGLLSVSRQEGWSDKLFQAMREASLTDSGKAMLAEMMIDEGNQYQDTQDMLRLGGIQFSNPALIDHITEKFNVKFGINPEEEASFVRGFRRNLGEVEVVA